MVASVPAMDSQYPPTHVKVHVRGPTLALTFPKASAGRLCSPPAPAQPSAAAAAAAGARAAAAATDAAANAAASTAAGPAAAPAVCTSKGC